MYPDFLKNVQYLTVKNLYDDKTMTYEQMRAHFSQMCHLCETLCSDIGHMDMVIQFDDEHNINEAKRLLTRFGINWKVRD